MADKPAPPARVRIWDAPTRIIHWSIVLLIAYLWWTEKNDDIAHHKLAGFALIGVLLFRLFWGVFGSQTARFSDFVRGPATIWRYLRGRSGIKLGHNPLGALSVIALLVLVAAESALGLFSIDEEGLEAGPLAPSVDIDWAQWAAHWHALLFDGLLALIALHIVAIAIYWLRGDNLFVPMITGRKHVDADGTLHFAPFWMVLIGIVLAGLSFYGLWRLDN